jgi:hypothetical protein
LARRSPACISEVTGAQATKKPEAFIADLLARFLRFLLGTARARAFFCDSVSFWSTP